MEPDNPTLYCFNNFTVDLKERRVLHSGNPVRIAPKVFDTLQILLENHGLLVRRADLMQKLWPDSIVEDATLGRNISDLRKLLGDEDHKLIETIPRIGYRFVGALKPAQEVNATVVAVNRFRLPSKFLLASAALALLVVCFGVWITRTGPRQVSPKLATVQSEPFPSATIAYARARYWYERRTREGLQNSIHLYLQGLKENPDNSRILAGLAESYVLLSGYGFDRRETCIPLARAYALRALQLNPDLGEAHNALALIAQNYDLDWVKAERQYQQAIRVAPQYAAAHHFYGEFLALMGRFEEGRKHLRIAQDLEPTSFIIATDYAQTYLLDGNTKRGNELLDEQVLKMDPNFDRAQFWLTIGLSLDNRCADARRSLDVLVRKQNSHSAVMAAGLLGALCGDRKSALNSLKQLEDWDEVKYFDRSLVYASLGNVEEAIASLRQAIERKEVGLVCLKVNPALKGLRGDQRFQALLESLRFPS